MGEAFGDLDALEYLNENHYVPVPDSNACDEGAYVTGNQVQRHPRLPRELSRWAATCRSPAHDPQTDPLNLGDYGFDIVGPEVHADGEIWVAVQFDTPRAVPDPLPGAGRRSSTSPCARGQVAVDAVPG